MKKTKHDRAGIPPVITALEVGVMLKVQVRSINTWAKRWEERGDVDLPSSPSHGLRCIPLPSGKRLPDMRDLAELLCNAVREEIGVDLIAWRAGIGIVEMMVQMGDDADDVVSLLTRSEVAKRVGLTARAIQEWNLRWIRLAQETGDPHLPSSPHLGLRQIQLRNNTPLIDERDFAEYLENAVQEKASDALKSWREGLSTASQGDEIGGVEPDSANQIGTA